MTKVTIADVVGKVRWSASRPYQYASTQPGFAEQDPEDWWQAVCEATRSLLHEHPEAVGGIRAVAVSGQGVAAILMDSSQRVLRSALLWLDQRSTAFSDHLSEAHGQEISAISGKAPASYNVEPKLLWIKRNEPEIWARVWKFFTATSYITYRLSGVPVMNHSDGGILLAYDLARNGWSAELLGKMGLPLAMYPELAACDAVIGEVTPQTAAETGLPPGIPVVAGGEDTSSAGLAMAPVSPATGQLSLGTANTIYVPVQRAANHPRLLAFPHVAAGWTLIGGSTAAGGLATRWIAKMLDPGHAAIDEGATLDRLTKEAEMVRCGADGLIFLPYLAGELQPINDGLARGLFFGLTAEMNRSHLVRAVLEGIAFAVEHNLSIARTIGVSPEYLVAVGGPTRNRLLCQIIADATALPLKVVDESCGAALGSAMLAAKGVGLSHFDEMRDAHLHTKAEYEPDSSSSARYRDLFKTYIELYPRVADLIPRTRQ